MADPPQNSWHELDPSETFDRLGSDPAGLSHEEAGGRLSLHGPNVLPHEPPPAGWQIFLRQFRNPLIYVLIVAAAVSLAIEEPLDAAFITAVLLLNAVIGWFEEWRAEKSALALQQLLHGRATVVRAGESREIDAEEVVPGDVVLLESGNRVPADARLLSAHGLEIDESLLTGESLPVHKDPHWRGPAATPVSDRRNMVHAGSIVVHGRSRALVVATGSATSVGRLALDVIEGPDMKPPLVLRMERFTRVIALSVLTAATAVVVGGMAVGGHPIAEMFLFGVALAVSAIPEGLPVAMTVALSVATNRMARRGVIVRKLAAVEGLGSCTLVATDKTGTLTVNELTVRELRLPDGSLLSVSGEGFQPVGEVTIEQAVDREAAEAAARRLARIGVLCNEATLYEGPEGWKWRGDTVDVAFLALGQKAGVEREALEEELPEVTRIPFEPERRFAAVYRRTSQGTVVAVKGAPERVLAMCELSPGDRRALEATADEMASRGYRVLALAEGRAPGDLDPSRVPPPPQRLTFSGLAGMIDPVRPGVVEAVEAFRKAGVRVCMVTGDHRVTALAIARQLGMAEDESQVLTGVELLEIPPEELPEIAERTTVFARVAPHQKLQVVDALVRRGELVAVTGDGVNDAPALRAAHIGVAMGRSGTDVAREASELVISDDNFATIINGVEEGRIAYDNVRKVIYLLVSTGAAEIVLVMLAVLARMPLPLLPVQLLWLNLVTNGIQDVALAFEGGESDVMRRSPRPPKERIFNRLMIERTLVASVVMGVVGFSCFRLLLSAGWELDEARNALLLLMVLFENVHIGNCRSETRSALRHSPLRSPILLGGAVTAFLVHVAAMHLPLGQILLGTAPLSWETWILLAALALTVFVAIEIHKGSWALRQAFRGKA